MIGDFLGPKLQSTVGAEETWNLLLESAMQARGPEVARSPGVGSSAPLDAQPRTDRARLRRDRERVETRSDPA